MTRAAVTERDARGLVPELGPARFIGRETELAALGKAVAAPPAVVLVEGEAGIGKSRLVREFLASPAAREHTSLVAACPPFRQPCTLGAVTDALRLAADDVAGLGLSDLAGALRPLFPEWTSSLPPAPEPLEDATAARYRIYRALAELLACLNVTLLVQEDAHWADEGTLEFLLFLASRQYPEAVRPRTALRLVVTYRPEDVPERSLLWRLCSQGSAAGTRARISLGPLDVAQTASLVSSMVGGGQVSGEFATYVHAHTDGLPLAIEESVRLMAERADLVRRDGKWVRRPKLDQITVPPTIRDAVLERAARLGATAQPVLRAAAVLAEPASERLLLAISGLPADQADDGLAAAISCGLLTADLPPNGRGLISFRHALAARAVYEAIPIPLRRQLHARAARVLESQSPSPVTALARHFREAGDSGKWCQYAERAVDLALSSGDEGTAATLLHDLVTRGGLPAADLARLMSKFPLALVTEPARYQALAAALRSALNAGDLDPAEEADARFQLGRLLVAMYDWNAAHAELKRAIPGLAHRPVTAATAMTMLGWPFGTEARADEHADWLRRAAGLVGRLPEADRLPLLVNRVTALLLLGEEAGWAEACRIPSDATAAHERRQITRGHMNICEAAMIWGRYGTARRHLAIALDLANAHDYRAYRGVAAVLQAHLDWLTGAWDGLAERAADLTGDEDIQAWRRMEAVLVAGLLHAARGEIAQARECLEQVAKESWQRGAAVHGMAPAGALAQLRLAEGRIDDALAVTEEPVRLIEAKGTWIWVGDLAPARVSALLATGRGKEATDLVTAFARGLDGRDAPTPRAALMLCRAILAEAAADYPRAASLFARATAAWQALPRPYDELLARERQAHCLLAAGRSEAGLALLGDVFRALSSLGAGGDAERVVRTLRGQGVHVPRLWRHGRRGYGSQLSPREIEVVRMIVAGDSTRTIARQLCRSPKTVDTQLSSAMRKLSVPSRAALAARAVEAGIVSGDSPQPDGAPAGA